MENQPAGFWVRLLALFIDYNIVGWIQGGILYLLLFLTDTSFTTDTVASVLGILMISTLLFLPTCYWAFFEASTLRATPGKKLFGLSVTDLNDQQIDLVRSFARNILKFLILHIPPFVVLYVVVAFHPKKRGIHDLICHTRVNYVDSRVQNDQKKVENRA